MIPILLAALVVGLGAAIATFLREDWGPSQTTLERRYRRPTSRFVVVDGVRLHCLDEGIADGPAVVMTPAQWMCFSQWDAWVPLFAERYRVIRIDLPGHGLAGPIPDGDYSFARYERLLIGALDALGVDRFALIGTSFGGTVAFRYAARADNRLWALVLANASGLPRAGGASPGEPPPRRLHRILLPYYRTRGFIAWKLRTLVHDDGKLTPALIRECADMNNRKGRLREAQARAAAYRVGDPETVLGRVTVPTLVQGSTRSTYLGADDAARFAAWLTRAPVRTRVYPGVGHLIALDGGETVAQDARDFLDDVLAGDRITRPA